jgi:uncharacterized RDD family membrane protein YckC
MPYCKNCGNELSSEAKFCPKCGTAVIPEQATTAPYETAAPMASGLKLAFWGERFVAWLIDAIILGVIVGLLGLVTWFAVGSFTWWSGWPSWVPFFNVSGVFYFLYWFLMDGAYGQSLGKMVMHLKVVRLDGSRMDMGKAALESFGKAFILPLDVLLGWILYTRRRQRLFNYVSGTIVIRETRV